MFVARRASALRRNFMIERRRVGAALTASFAAGLAACVLASAAVGYTTAPGYVAQEYATGFPESQANRWGPIGTALDAPDNHYVADVPDGNVDSCPPGGGTASR